MKILTLATGIVSATNAYSQSSDSTEVENYSMKVRKVETNLDLINLGTNPQQELKKYDKLNRDDKKRAVDFLAEILVRDREKYENLLEKYAADAKSKKEFEAKYNEVRNDNEKLEGYIDAYSRQLNNCKCKDEDKKELRNLLDEIDAAYDDSE